MIKHLKNLGDDIIINNNKWSFKGDELASRFDSHIKRSVPFYNEGHDLILGLSDYFIRRSDENSTVYDLGSSLGHLSYALYERHKDNSSLSWQGIEKEAAMTKLAQKSYAHHSYRLTFSTADITNFSFESTKFVICYYVLQFIEIELRKKLLQNIFDAMTSGGALIVFEKTLFENARTQDIMSNLYSDFKLKNEYTPWEIMGKQSSLKGILSPLTCAQNQVLLKETGFSEVSLIMKNLGFSGYLAYKA